MLTLGKVACRLEEKFLHFFCNFSVNLIIKNLIWTLKFRKETHRKVKVLKYIYHANSKPKKAGVDRKKEKHFFSSVSTSSTFVNVCCALEMNALQSFISKDTTLKTHKKG